MPTQEGKEMKNNKSNKKYTDEEVQYVIDHYLTHSDEEIAAVLGRNRANARHKRFREGWTKEGGATSSP